MRFLFFMVSPLLLSGCSSSSSPAGTTDAGGDSTSDIGSDSGDSAGSGADTCGSLPSDAACPPLASACPCGCMATDPRRWDATRKCIEPATDVICSNDGCATATGCWTRTDTGDAYYLFCLPLSALHASGSPWQECTDAQKAAMGLYPPPPACP